MAETIRGINVVIGSDTTGLSKALSDVNQKSRDIQSELKQVEKLLKLDPANTELVAQKQKLLGDAVANTRGKLDALRKVQQQVNEQFVNGKINEGQYRAFRREIAKAEQQLKGFEKTAGNTKTSLADLGKSFQKTGGDVSESFTKVGTGLTAIGAGVATGLGLAVKGAADFEQGLSNIKAVSGATGDEMAKLKELAMDMGAETKYSATEAASGIEELIKAGVSAEDIMSGGLKGALSLATAGELELADAAEIASTALNAFKADNLTVQQAADILAGAANASATSVGELKFGMSAVSAVASAVGMSFKDTTTALALFAQNGLKGSDAGTSLKTMLMNLQPVTDGQHLLFEKLGLKTIDAAKAMQFLSSNGIKPASDSQGDLNEALYEYVLQTTGFKAGSKKAKDAFDELKGSMTTNAFYDQSGQLKDLNQIAGILQGSMKNMTDQQRLAAMETLFGSDAIRAANILFKEGAQGADNMAKAMGKVTSDQVAAEKMNNLKWQIEQLSGAAETAAISVGDALLPAIKYLAGGITTLVDGFNSLPGPVKTTIAVGAALTAAFLLIGGPLLMLIGFIPQIIAGLTMMGVVSTTASGAMGLSFGVIGTAARLMWLAITGPVGLVVLAIAAVVTAGVLLYKHWDQVKAAAERIWKGIKSFIIGIWDGITSAIKGAINTIIQTVNGMINALNKVSFKIPDWFPVGGGKNFGFNIPNIPKLAEGGIVTKPTLALIGEAGPEAVVPLKRGAAGGITLNFYGPWNVRSQSDIDQIVYGVKGAVKTSTFAAGRRSEG